mgnify:CR=1 FL=1
MKTRSLPAFFVHIAVFAPNQMEYLRFENHLAVELGLYHYEKNSITKSRQHAGYLQREYSYKFQSLDQVLALGVQLGAMQFNEKLGLNLIIETR